MGPCMGHLGRPRAPLLEHLLDPFRGFPHDVIQVRASRIGRALRGTAPQQHLRHAAQLLRAMRRGAARARDSRRHHGFLVVLV